ncbi:uridine kinase [Alteromonadaceae bacterium BrNp21-10]|nr:uridine kinase [Alteromonadaceae bacterium BrNp21-10]
MTTPHIIAISGASGSGKSLFTQTLCNELNSLNTDITILCEDHYYRDQSHMTISDREQTNYDHPDAFEHDLLAHHLQQLVKGETIDYPSYCFKTHTREKNTQTLSTNKIILVEGIMLLACKPLNKLFDLKVYIDTPLDICLLRRIKRDLVERGRSIESISKQYEQTVKPMYHQFIQPCRHKADIVVTQGGKNRPAIEVVKAHIQKAANA